jgi:hypothetical protein
MRKTKACNETWLQQRPLRLRTCLLARFHDGMHLDEHGRWRPISIQELEGQESWASDKSRGQAR